MKRKKHKFYHTFRTWLFIRWIMKRTKRTGAVLLYGKSGVGKTSMIETIEGISYISSQELSDKILRRMIKTDKKEIDYSNEIVVIDNIETIVASDNVAETIVKLFYEYVLYLSKKNTVICISTNRDRWFKKRVRIKPKLITRNLIRVMARDNGLKITRKQRKQIYLEYKNNKGEIGSLKGKLMMLNMINYMD